MHSPSKYIKDCPSKCTSKWIKIHENCLMEALASKLMFQGFLWRNFYSQKTCVANPLLLTSIQPKIDALKFRILCPIAPTNKQRKRKRVRWFWQMSWAVTNNYERCWVIFKATCYLILCLENFIWNYFVVKNICEKIFCCFLVPTRIL